ncbi:hypothetical protein FQN54_006629 [Arachnomyces sp. PD_36]|nr:hypothetical protein FQN54_006629 [Arachnomyces sp. PD_36]
MKPAKKHNDPVKSSKIKTPRKMENEDDDRREADQYDEISEARDSFWIDDLPDNKIVYFETTDTSWKADKIFSERQMHDGVVPEASALCVVTQFQGPEPGLKAMLRIRKQIPRDVYDPSQIEPTDDYTLKEPYRLGDYAEMELDYLNHATKKGSTCTPKLIDFHPEVQSESDCVPNGFLLYILMEKVPGRNLVNFGELEMFERDQIRIAFAKAILEFSTVVGLTHEDHHRRNLVWDRKNKKIYIVDLEAATHYGVRKPSLSVALYFWGLAGPSVNSRDGVDPMVPDIHGFTDHFPSEQELVKIAAAAKGKPVRPKLSPWDSEVARVAREAREAAEKEATEKNGS